MSKFLSWEVRVKVFCELAAKHNVSPEYVRRELILLKRK